jgi:outer membrane protein assembly factor BamA
VDQGITEQLTLVGDVYYTYDLYEYEKDSDGNTASDKKVDIYSASLGLKYAFNEWLNAGVGYKYKEKSNNSDYDTDNYTDHIYSFTVGATF